MKVFKEIKKRTEHSETLTAFTPVFASASAKLVATPASLPFEQLATRRQAGITNAPFKVSFTGFGNVLLREIIFSAAFWSTNERLYQKLANRYAGEGSNRKLSKETCTSLSAFVSGLVAGAISYPFDAIRTWKMVNTNSNQNLGWVDFWRNLRSSHLISGKTTIIQDYLSE